MLPRMAPRTAVEIPWLDSAPKVEVEDIVVVAEVEDEPEAAIELDDGVVVGTEDVREGVADGMLVGGGVNPP